VFKIDFIYFIRSDLKFNWRLQSCINTANRTSLPNFFGVAVAMRGSGMQWSFSNKVSAIPQFLSFKSSLEDKPRKAVHDPVASSSGLVSISTTDAFDSNQKTYSGLVQVCC